MKLITQPQLPLAFALILSWSVLLEGCTFSRSRSRVENKTGFTLANTRLLVVDEQTRTVTIGTLAPNSKVMTYLPASFGEASLKIEFSVNDKLYSSMCGYVEDQMYVYHIVVEEGMKVTCQVDLSFF